METGVANVIKPKDYNNYMDMSNYKTVHVPRRLVLVTSDREMYTNHVYCHKEDDLEGANVETPCGFVYYSVGSDDVPFGSIGVNATQMSLEDVRGSFNIFSSFVAAETNPPIYDCADVLVRIPFFQGDVDDDIKRKHMSYLNSFLDGHVLTRGQAIQYRYKGVAHTLEVSRILDFNKNEIPRGVSHRATRFGVAI